MKRILFVCVENAGRSQTVEAFANSCGKGKIIASSAGVRLADKINPIVIGVMEAKGIDISSSKPKLLTPEMVEKTESHKDGMQRREVPSSFSKVTD